MPDEKEYEDIKAGVEGVIPEAPSPSETDIPITETVAAEDSTLPETNYSQPKYAGYGETPAYNTGNQLDMERIHEIIEAIIGEKWQEVMSNVGNIAVWKEKTNNDIISIKQELIRLQERFEQLQNAVLGRVKEYDEGIKGVHTEMKALEKVFERILEPLTSNIKDLTRITQDLKKIKH